MDRRSRTTRVSWSHFGVVLAVVALTAIGCSSSNNDEQSGSPAATVPSSVAPTTAAPTTAPPPATGDLSGTWSGQYGGAFHGTFSLTWTESGQQLTGTIKLSTTPGTLDLNGVVTGSTISFGTVGSSAVTYTGTVSGDSMSGTYEVGGGAGGDWSATKDS